MKKRYNWKARQVVQVDIDNSKKNKLEVDIPVTSYYDNNNEFILPEEKRKTKIKDNRPKVTKILSNKHRKRLEKVVDRRKKKANRATLLESLAQVQASPQELQQLISLSAVQTKGLKKHFLEQQYPDRNVPKPKAVPQETHVLNSLQGSKRKRLNALTERNEISRNDPNVLGFDDSSDEYEDSDEQEEQDVPKKIKFESDSNTSPKQNGSVTKSSLFKSETSDSIDTKNETLEEVVIPKTDRIKTQKKETTLPSKPATYVDIIRTSEIQAARLKLPILAEEQLIMETINENDVVILAGETGSGKTTQVPQFLYEAGYAQTISGGIIAITEPRRMAAVAMSRRVAHEMSLGPDRVSYLIRFEGNTSDDTQIKFMTDGVLLKEIQTDFLLNKYSVVILDEAHERSVYTDILIGLLSRIVPLRRKRGQPLKLIVMSATLRLSDFTENRRLFKVSPPVVKVDARQWPVTVHFNKRTPEDYVCEAYAKACKVHTNLPDGGLLIFVTGQSEVTTLVRRLRNTFPCTTTTTGTAPPPPTKSQRSKAARRRTQRRQRLTVAPSVDLDDYSLPGDVDDDDDVEVELSDEDMDGDDQVGMQRVDRSRPLWVLPLFSMLGGEQQARVFDKVPDGYRLCVVSTNVAETSLTIPNVRYVIDTGRTKRRLYDSVTGASQYAVTWCSKAAAEQRAGRAGRTAPGHCYRLYSSAVYNDQFQQFAQPEIQMKAVDDLYLQMRCMGVDRVVNFPFPSAPNLLQLKSAELRLGVLGALSYPIVDGVVSEVTPLGRAIARFPLLPRYGKMLALSHQFNLLPYTICLVAALSVQEVLLETPIGGSDSDGDNQIRERWRQVRQLWAGTGHSLLLGDAMVLLKAVGGAEYANSQNKLEKFCADNGLRQKAILEIRKLRLQLTGEIKTNVPDSDVSVDPQLSPPTDLQTKLLRQILLAGLCDQVARKVPLTEVAHLPTAERAQFKYAYRITNMEDVVHMRRGCVLRRTLPEYVVFQEVYEAAEMKMYMRGVTAIETDWLPTYVPALCSLGRPLEQPPPRFCQTTGNVLYTVTGTFGPQSWQISAVEVPIPPTDTDRYKWFARFLLEGAVFAPLARFTTALLSPPLSILRDWAKLQPRVLTLVKCLAAHDVRTREGLETKWEVDEKFLLAEYLKWLPASAHEEVRLIWPPKREQRI